MNDKLPKFSPLALMGLIALGLLFGSCKQNVSGPTDSQNRPQLLVSPKTGLINTDITFTAVPYNVDSGSKVFLWTFPDRSDTIATRNTLKKNFSRPGTYKYTIWLYHNSNKDTHIILRDTESITIYSYMSSITPALLQAIPNKLYTFRVRPDSVLTGTNYTYVWQFGENGHPITVKNTDTVQYAFADTGLFFVDVKIYDNAIGLVSEGNSTVVIGGDAPRIAISPRVAAPGRAQVFTASHQSLGAREFTLTWDFGDGSTLSGMRNSDTISHRYQRSGHYLVRARGYETLTGGQFFDASDTCWVSSIDPSAMTIAPTTLVGTPGVRYLFTVTPPTLDPHHAYHWIWKLASDHLAIVRDIHLDTLTASFIWPGRDSITVVLFDDSLGYPAGLATADLDIESNLSNFDPALVGQMTTVTANFHGEHHFGELCPGVSPPTVDWLFLAADSAKKLGAHLSGDSLHLRNGHSFYTSDGTNSERYSDQTIIDVVFSVGRLECAVVSASGGRSDETSHYNIMTGNSWGGNSNESGGYTAHHLQLLSYSPTEIQYGLRPQSAESLVTDVTFDGLCVFEHGGSPCSNHYINTNWQSTTTPPSVVVTFSR